MKKQTKVKTIIAKDKRDEKKAKLGYRKLAKDLRKQGRKADANRVSGIAKDEGDHFRILTKIRKSL